MKLAAACLALLLASPALADGPGDWTIAGDPDEPMEAGRLHASLWLPIGPGPGITFGDVLGRHAAAYRERAPRTIVLIEGVFAPDRLPVLAWERATLTPRGGEPVRLPAGELHERWLGRAVGPEHLGPLADGGRVRATWCLPFPAFLAGLDDLTLEVPALDDVPLRVRFRRWTGVLKEVEADLADWKKHIAASRERSAIGAYLAHDSVSRLRAHGDRVVATLMLRELRAGEERGDPDAVPRFLALKLLAATAWGWQQGVPDHGDEKTAARVLARWRALGHPVLPGILPHEPRERR
jgi:hypothetical protein